MMFTVEHLLDGRPKPISITADKTVTEALSLMAEHDFGQLPVIDDLERPSGIITTASILRAACHFGIPLTALKVTEAADQPTTIRFDGDLFDLLRDVQRSSAVLITDANDRLIGIVTHYDVAEYFQTRAQDMMMVEDIETTLKQFIAALYQGENGDDTQLKAAIADSADHSRKLKKKYQNALSQVLKHLGTSPAEISEQVLDESFRAFGLKEQQRDLDELTLDEFTILLLRHQKCPKVGLLQDPTGVRQLLAGVRDTRNALAHFRREITAQERDQLRFCSDWLSRAFAEIQPKTKPPKAVNLEPVDAGATPPTDEDSQASDSMYAPLATMLLSMSTNEVWLTLEQIEGALKYPLPASARVHRAWWANDRSHSHARQWLDAGWKVKNVSGGGVTFSRTKEREEAYNAFFALLASSLKEKKQINPPEATPNGRSYFCCALLRGSMRRQLRVYASFARNGRLRIELYIGLGDKFQNKQCWQLLFDQHAEIERHIDEPLTWERLDNKSAARVALYHPGPNASAIDASVIAWATEAVAKFLAALREPVRKVLDVVQNKPEKATAANQA